MIHEEHTTSEQLVRVAETVGRILGRLRYERADFVLIPPLPGGGVSESPGQIPGDPPRLTRHVHAHLDDGGSPWPRPPHRPSSSC